jgi:predicted DNA-binding ribbon-helix-helix protein
MHQEPEREAGRAGIDASDTVYVIKRSVTIRGHRTSFSLEQPFFEALAEIAVRREISLAALVAEVDRARPKGANLSSALRVFVLDAVRQPEGDDPASSRTLRTSPEQL